MDMSTPTSTPTPKPVGNIDMNFEVKNEDDVKNATTTTQEGEDKPIVFEDNGKKVYTVKNGVYTFYDADGKQLSEGAVDTLNQAYKEFPEFDSAGRAKDGPVLKFPVDANGKQPGQNGYDGKVEMTGYKQRYKGEDGSMNTLDHTIPEKFASIIKVLRGEIGHNVTKPEEKEKVLAPAAQPQPQPQPQPAAAPTEVKKTG